MMRKLKIIIACWGTVVAIAIIISVFFILFGMEDKIEIFFYLHFSAGAIVIFILFRVLFMLYQAHAPEQ